MGVVFKGDHEPLKLYKGDTLVQEPTTLKKSGTSLTFEQSYNHSAEVEVAGKSEQVRLTGKNLIPFPYAAKSSVLNGVSFTVNDDGSVTAKGTATGSSYFALNGGYASNMKPIPSWLEPGKTYTMSAGSTLPAGTGMRVYRYTSNTAGESYAYMYGGATSKTFTMPTNDSEWLYFGLFLFVQKGATVDFTWYPQLELGSTATPYEPYCGGIPSPSPDYPQPIKSIESVELVSRGRNLVSSVRQYNMANQYAHTLKVKADLKPGTAYTLSFIGASGNLAYVNENFQYKTLTATGERQSVTFTTPANLSKGTSSHYSSGEGWILLKNQPSNPVAASFSDVMLEAGTTSHPYEPYHSTTRTIDLRGNQLRSLPDGTHDILYVKRTGECWIEKMVGTSVSLGKSWSKSVAFPGGYYANVNQFDFNAKKNPGIAGICSHLRGVAKLSEYEVGTFFIDSSFNFRVGNDVAATVGEFYQWAEANNPTIQYPLNTPQTITLPSIEPLPTYWPTTVITDTNGNDISAFVKVVE